VPGVRPGPASAGGARRQRWSGSRVLAEGVGLRRLPESLPCADGDGSDQHRDDGVFDDRWRASVDGRAGSAASRDANSFFKLGHGYSFEVRGAGTTEKADGWLSVARAGQLRAKDSRSGGLHSTAAAATEPATSVCHRLQVARLASLDGRPIERDTPDCRSPGPSLAAPIVPNAGFACAPVGETRCHPKEPRRISTHVETGPSAECPIGTGSTRHLMRSGIAANPARTGARGTKLAACPPPDGRKS
jgi:hypothetical protein